MQRVPNVIKFLYIWRIYLVLRSLPFLQDATLMISALRMTHYCIFNILDWNTSKNIRDIRLVKITSKGTSLPKVRNHFTKIKTLHRYPPFFPLTLRKIRRCYDWPLKDSPTFTHAHVPNAVPYNGIISGTLSTESPQRQAAALRDLVELVKYRIVYMWKGKE